MSASRAELRTEMLETVEQEPPAATTPAGPRSPARPAVAAPVGALLLAAALPVVLSEYWAYVFNLFFVFGTLFLSIVLLTGFAGQISLAPIAFLGTGAFTAALLSSQHDWPFVIAVLAGGVATAGFGTIVSLPALRLRGMQLAVVTLAFAYFAERALFRWSWFTGGFGSGLRVPAPRFFTVPLESDRAFFYAGLAVFVATVLGVRAIRDSRTGRVLHAIRMDADAVAAMGNNVAGYKIAVFALSGFIAGVAGGMFAYLLRSVTPEQFSVFSAFTVVTLAVVGGVGSIWGAVFAAAIFAPVPELMRGFPSLNEYIPLTSGLFLIDVVRRHPAGLAELLEHGALRRLLRRSAQKGSR